MFIKYRIKSAVNKFLLLYLETIILRCFSNILSFDFLADDNLQDNREKYFFAKLEEIGQHQYQEQLILPLKLWASKH